MKVIGLTGGMGTGKSTVSSYLKQQGIPVVDADMIAHDITEKNSPILRDIRTLLGDQVFYNNGEMNRHAVAEIIFRDQEKLKAYEAITTKAVLQKSLEQIEGYRKQGMVNLIVYDAPLLFECNFQHHVDETWLVDAAMGVRLSRIAKRDGLTKEQILDRINHQMSTEEKAKLADFVIDNSGDLEGLYSQVEQLLERIANER